MQKSLIPPSLYSRFILIIDILLYTTVVSLVIFGVGGYITSQILTAMPIRIWVLIFIISFITVLLFMIISNKNFHTDGTFSLKSYILGLLPYLLLIPGLLAVIISTRIQISNHGPYHMGYIIQILSGLSPPENPVLPGYPANNYWLYHALLSVIVYIFNIAPSQASAALNFGALLGSLYFIRKSVRALGFSKNNSFLRSFYSLFILFGANLFAWVYILFDFIIQANLRVKPLMKMIWRDDLVLAGDIRIQNLFMKFMNFTALGIGVFYFCFSLYICILIIKGKLTTWNILLLSIAILGALMFHPTTGIFALLVIPASLLTSIVLSKKQAIKSYIQNTKSYEITVLIIAIVILYAPILDYIHKAASALPVGVYYGKSIAYNLKSILSAAYPLIPIAIFGIVFSYAKKTSTIVFFSTICILGYALTLIIDLPHSNQYKFVYLTTISFCFLSVFGLDYLYYGLRGRFGIIGKFIVYVLLIILSLNLVFSGIRYLRPKKVGVNKYSYDKKHIILKEGSLFKESYQWIRENTPPETIVILPFPSKNREGPHRLNGDIYLIGERLPYVAYGHIYTEGIDEYYERVEDLILFYSDETEIDEKVEILGDFEKFSQERPSVLLIPKDDVELLTPYLDKMNLLYSGKDADIYEFKARE